MGRRQRSRLLRKANQFCTLVYTYLETHFPFHLAPLVTGAGILSQVFPVMSGLESRAKGLPIAPFQLRFQLGCRKTRKSRTSHRNIGNSRCEELECVSVFHDKD